MHLTLCSMLLLLLLPFSLAAQDGKRVLVYNPYLGYHHTHFMGTIANALRAEGHHVTVLDSHAFTNFVPFNTAADIETMDVSQCDMARQIAENGDKSDAGLRAFWDKQQLMKKIEGGFGFYSMNMNFSTIMAEQCNMILNSNETMTRLRETKFDLAITEVFDFCGLGLFDVLKPAKIILASSVPLHEYILEMLGLPKALDRVLTKFAVETLKDHRESYGEFSIGGFAQNAITSAIFGQTMFGFLLAKENRIFEEYYTDHNIRGVFPGMKSMLKRAHLLLENVHPLLDLNNPTLNSIKPIGGITVNKGAALKEVQRKQADEITRDMEEVKRKGMKVVLVSFGTVMDPTTMKNDTKDNLIAAFKSVSDATFFWKVQKEDFFPKDEKNVTILPENIKAFEWMPQNELLASGLVDLFVSHMGIGSMTEAAGVPFVAIPIFVDQHYNYLCARRLGIAQYVDKTSLAVSPDQLSSTIVKALNNTDMRKRSTQLKQELKMYGNQTETMMKHINFVLSLEDSTPIVFEHHHKEMSVGLSLRSLIHLTPYYALPITAFISLFIVSFILCCAGRIEFDWEMIGTTCCALIGYILLFAIVTKAYHLYTPFRAMLVFIFIIDRIIYKCTLFSLINLSLHVFDLSVQLLLPSLPPHCLKVIRHISEFQSQHIFPIANRLMDIAKPFLRKIVSATFNVTCNIIIAVFAIIICMCICPEFFNIFQQ